MSGRSTLHGLLACALALAAVGLSAGCADNGDDSAPTPSTAGTPVADVTAGPPGIVDGQTFISVARAYKVDFPEGWQPDENFFITSDFAFDAFLAPEPVNGVKPNIIVRCEYQREGNFTSESFLQEKRGLADGFAQGEVAEQAVTIAGEQALQLTYTRDTGGQSATGTPVASLVIDKQEIHFVSHGCGWSIELTHAADDDQYTELFATILASFAFTGEGT